MMNVKLLLKLSRICYVSSLNHRVYFVKPFYTCSRILKNLEHFAITCIVDFTGIVYI